jgi:hypothetical protein
MRTATQKPVEGGKFSFVSVELFFYAIKSGSSSRRSFPENV